MLQQRLEEFYQEAEAYPVKTEAHKRAPGMEFLGKRSQHRQQFDIPNKRAPGVMFYSNIIPREAIKIMNKRSIEFSTPFQF